jgi:thioredoxin 1
MVKIINEENFEKEVLKSELPVLVDFFASWCGPCKMLGPILDEIEPDFNGKLKILKVSTEESPELAQEYGIRSIPNMKIFNKGQVVDEIVGFAPAPLLKNMIQEKIDNL